VFAALLAIPTVALASTSRQVWAPNCNKAQYKPKQLVISCGDANNLVKSLTWSSWTSSKATGKGANAVNDCTPSCVAGHFHSYPAAVTLSKPKSCPKVKGHKVFGEIKLVYVNKHPGSKKTYHSTLGCPTG
jgi:hypothetical protein